mmetsp:Transcript_8050/g.14759  ORF Transcript_8050/g.14759 Transcript_8050/m.14759 type:complete len:182 (-) Transcript_8050:1263-1808(-)
MHIHMSICLAKDCSWRLIGICLIFVELPSTSAESIHHEGTLTRKHDWEHENKKASNRSWDKVYVVLNGNLLSCYKDKKIAKQDPNNLIHHEQPINLSGAQCFRATDYTKRPHVFRLKLTTGGEYLFHAKDDGEMDLWIQKVISVTGAEGTSVPSKSMTLPARMEGEKEGKKKKGFLTMKKK